MNLLKSSGNLATLFRSLLHLIFVSSCKKICRQKLCNIYKSSNLTTRCLGNWPPEIAVSFLFLELETVYPQTRSVVSFYQQRTYLKICALRSQWTPWYITMRCLNVWNSVSCFGGFLQNITKSKYGCLSMSCYSFLIMLGLFSFLQSF